ncbi:MAG: hypothetical protein HZY74_02505 [Brevundimonas sp.]|nr:MAG: hypothetical protein HZY74_02505 [Brevundimonas sp.]
MAIRTFALAILFALATLVVVKPAQAQVNGTWTFELGEVRLEIDNRSTIAGQTPPWIATTTTLMPGDSRTVFPAVIAIWCGRGIDLLRCDPAADGCGLSALRPAAQPAPSQCHQSLWPVPHPVQCRREPV